MCFIFCLSSTSDCILCRKTSFGKRAIFLPFATIPIRSPQALCYDSFEIPNAFNSSANKHVVSIRRELSTRLPKQKTELGFFFLSAKSSFASFPDRLSDCNSTTKRKNEPGRISKKGIKRKNMQHLFADSPHLVYIYVFVSTRLLEGILNATVHNEI